MDWLWRLDLQLFREINLGWHSSWLDPIFWALSYSGLGQVQAIAILALCWKRSKAWIAPLLTSLILSGFVLRDPISHLLIHRDRPSNLPYAIAQEAFRFNGFPSGHSTTTFSIAAMLILLTWRTEKAWIGGVGLVWAVLVGLSRIYRGVHWPTDVLGGAFLGLAGACLAYLICERLGKLPERASTLP